MHIRCPAALCTSGTRALLRPALAPVRRCSSNTSASSSAYPTPPPAKTVLQVLGVCSVGAMFYFQSEKLGQQARRLALLEAAIEKGSPEVYAAHQQALASPPPLQGYAVIQPVAERLFGKGAKFADVLVAMVAYPAICLLVAGVTHRISRHAASAMVKNASAQGELARRALGATGAQMEEAVQAAAVAVEEVAAVRVAKVVAVQKPNKRAVMKLRRSLTGNMGSPSVLHVRRALGGTKLARRRALPQSLQFRNVKESRALPPPPQSLITPAELTAKRQSLEEMVDELNKELNKDLEELLMPSIAKGSQFELDGIDGKMETDRSKNKGKEDAVKRHFNMSDA